MILVGNQRGGAKDLALHLLKEENEHVEVHELRGFASENLVSALNEAYAISRGTKCRQFLFSLSLNPPASENVKTDVFEATIKLVEDDLGLTGQPRAIVFHEKEGRRHCHAVWSRIDTVEMKAVHLPYTKRKLQTISRELYLEHDWKMPHGLMVSEERDPRNFTLGEWQQAKRTGKDPRAIKTTFQDCWVVSDTGAAFAQALRERGYILARGDRRGFVAVDYRGEVYAVAKWVGIKTKEVRAKLNQEQYMPSVDEARSQIASDMTVRLRELEKVQHTAISNRMAALEDKRRSLTNKHIEERKALSKILETRWQLETEVRQHRYNKGIRGLFDRLTGHHKRINQQNEQEAYEALLRDQREKDEFIFRQLEQRRTLQARMERLRKFKTNREQELSRDITQYVEMRDRRQDVFLRERNQSAGPQRTI